MHQLGLAWTIYANDNNGELVQSYPTNNPYAWVQGNLKNPAETGDTALLKAGKLYSYTPNPSVYRCPTDEGVPIDGKIIPSARSYSMNSFMGGRDKKLTLIPKSAAGFVPFFAREAEIRRPRDRWVFIDEDNRSISDGFFVTDPAARIWFDFPSVNLRRHNFSFTINFADGHSEIWRLRDPRTRLVTGNETEQAGNSDLERLALASTDLE
jgi:prepilin-type processing-associated H-X9-DG protein